jgi:hypothetical protein
MLEYNPRKPLFSIHIPKCAGSAFSNILKSWFGTGYLRHYYNEQNNSPPERYKLKPNHINGNVRDKICVHGHFNNNRKFGIRDYYPKATQIITIMRDPFELHLSNYFYVKQLAISGGAYRSGKLHPIIKNGWNVEDYLENSRKSYILNFFPFDISLDNYQDVLSNQFIYIGITEQLQKSINILANILGFQSYSVNKKNVSEWNETLPLNARKKFKNDNKLEFAIYDYARNHWGNNF